MKTPEKKGDILVFLTSQEEIEAFIELTWNNVKTKEDASKLKILPLYAGLPLDD